MRRCSVVLLLNIVPPYRVALFQALEREVRRLTVLVSTGMRPLQQKVNAWNLVTVRLKNRQCPILVQN